MRKIVCNHTVINLVVICFYLNIINCNDALPRKCHIRALESMQGSLEAEAKSKAEALRLKKKLESDINELEISLDHSNKAYSDLQRSYKKTQGEFKELQIKFEEEQRLASELREQLSVSERRANGLHIELEEARTLLEQSDRGRRQTESELADSRELFGNTNNQFSALTINKRKLDGEWQTLHVSIYT